MPDLIRYPASSSGTEVSGIPDQVRGDKKLGESKLPSEAQLTDGIEQIWYWLLGRPDGTIPLVLAAIYFAVASSMVLGLGDPRHLALSPAEMAQLKKGVMELAKPMFKLAIFLGLLGYVIRALSFIGTIKPDQKNSIP